MLIVIMHKYKAFFLEKNINALFFRAKHSNYFVRHQYINTYLI